MPLPSAPFDPAKSIFAGLSIVVIKIGATEHVFESKMLKHKLDQELKHIERPDAKGILRRVRTVIVKQFESWQFEIDEAKRVIDLFDGALAGRVDAKCTIWTPDPDDATGKVALKSEEEFDVSFTREGDLDFGNSEFTKVTINIDSNEQHAIEFEVDADIPA
jgi:hypothetical protein